MIYAAFITTKETFYCPILGDGANFTLKYFSPGDGRKYTAKCQAAFWARSHGLNPTKILITKAADQEENKYSGLFKIIKS